MNRILITGATGTFGKVFIQKYCELDEIKNIILFSRDEFKQHNIKNDLIQKYGNDFVEKKFRFFLGDIRDKERLALATKNVDVVIHAAALKHVPFCEYNPGEAILTNVSGTKNVCDESIKNNVKKLVVLSTDKAVEPINFYGSTKIIAEKYAIHSNLYAQTTRISCVRYGNIVGSRGSIIETFRKQITENRPFDITGEEMTRFWMHINDAASLVMWSIKNCIGGEIIVPKLKASKMLDIAKTLDADRHIRIVGVRPGEKIHEQLFSRREYLTAFENANEPYYVIVPENSEFVRTRSHYANFWNPCKRLSYSSSDLDIQMTKNELHELIQNE